MNAEDEAALDAILAHQQELAHELALALQAKAEWEAFVAEVRATAIKAGKEAAQNALPFLVAALRTAILAA